MEPTKPVGRESEPHPAISIIPSLDCERYLLPPLPGYQGGVLQIEHLPEVVDFFGQEFPPAFQRRDWEEERAAGNQGANKLGHTLGQTQLPKAGGFPLSRPAPNEGGMRFAFPPYALRTLSSAALPGYKGRVPQIDASLKKADPRPDNLTSLARIRDRSDEKGALAVRAP
ncbi:MAG: hypothetical protein WB560_00590 [Desulfobaccales bacterium]